MKKLSHFLGTVEGKFVAFIALLVVLAFGYYFYAMNGREAVPVGEVIINEGDHVRGSRGAPVTIVEFGDFQCPACKAYEPMVRQIVADNPGTVQLVFKHFPLTQIHPNAMLAAKASEAAGKQGRFWEMHDILYDKQSEWSGNLNARDIFIGYAVTLGLDINAFTEALSDADIQKKIVAEIKEGTSLGVGGTPTFFVNGQAITNPQSMEEFDQIIKAAAQAVSAQ